MKQRTVEVGLSWLWLGIQVVVPTLMALAVAIPLWRKRHALAGSVAGTAVIMFATMMIVSRELIALFNVRSACLKAGTRCLVAPSDEARTMIYIGIGFLEVCTLFEISLMIDRRRRREGYAPEWQDQR